MKLVSEQKTCTVCNKPLTWWTSQSCIGCGKVVCGQHAHAIKRKPTSSVLFSYCDGCSGSHAHQHTNHAVLASK